MNDLFVKNEALSEKYAVAMEEATRLKQNAEKMKKQKQLYDEEMGLRSKVVWKIL
jgi:hypothetical protein